MSAINDLASIVQRIKHRIKGGALNFMTLMKLLTARVEAEERFSQILKGSLSEAVDRSDPLLFEVFEDIRVESDLHLRYATELKNNVLTPMKTYSQAMADRQKKLLGQLKKDAEPLNKVWDEVDKAKRASEEAVAAAAKTPPPKREQLERKAQKARDEYQAKCDKADSVAIEFRHNCVPGLKAQFGEFDGSRLSTMQGAVRQFGRTRLLFSRTQIDASSSLLEKMEAFDGKGRSARYLIRAFDPKSTDEAESAENPLAIAIADYRSDEPRDLQFRRGEQIRLASRHTCGWWIGEIEGRKGFVPKTFISIPEETETGTTEFDETFVVLREFSAREGPGFLDLLPGDIVLLTSEAQGRCVGKNLRTGKEGFFPLTAIDSTV
jgi:hypothetical protein